MNDDEIGVGFCANCGCDEADHDADGCAGCEDCPGFELEEEDEDDE